MKDITKFIYENNKQHAWCIDDSSTIYLYNKAIGAKYGSANIFIDQSNNKLSYKADVYDKEGKLLVSNIFTDETAAKKYCEDEILKYNKKIV